MERHMMLGTAMVARDSGDGQPSLGRPRLVDEELADQLLGRMTRPRGQRLVLRKTMTGGRVRFRSEER